MEDAALGALPAQDAVSEDQLDAFRLAVDPTIKGVKGLEELHRLARRLLGARPLVTKHCPAPKRAGTRRIRGEMYGQDRAIPLRFLARLGHQREMEGIIPPGFQPGGNLVGGLGRPG